jgi:hypothetical protein
MGNAITAHILYACAQTDLDLVNFFSSTGDAHNIRSERANRKDLCPWHADEWESMPPNAEVILEIKTSAEYKLLEIKMGYNKFLLEEPTFENILKFYRIDKQSIDHRALWQEFYNNIKDPSWPQCDSPNDIGGLPEWIQQEILDKHQSPVTSATEKNFFNLLTIAFYDHFTLAENHRSLYGGRVVLLEDYLAGNIDDIKSVVVDKLNWKWDNTRSNKFYSVLLHHNAQYLDWINHMQKMIQSIIDGEPIRDKHISEWEKIAITALVCKRYGMRPEILPWDRINAQNFDLELIEFFKENHGQTV